MNRVVVRRGIVLAALLLVLGGCVNLEAVRQFAKTSAATADYQRIVADYATSPTRQKRYAPARAHAALDAEAARRAEQRRALSSAQQVVVEYMSALGDLAADDLTDYSKQIEGLRASLDKVGVVGDGAALVDKKTAAAGVKIADVILEAMANGYRQAKLAEVIREANDPLQNVLAGLREIVTKDFERSLSNEAEAIRKPFEAVVSAAGTEDESELKPIARILLEERLEQIEARRAQLTTYAAVLDKIAAGHADLLAGIGRFDSKDLQRRLKGYAKDLQTLVKAYRELGV